MEFFSLRMIYIFNLKKLNVACYNLQSNNLDGMWDSSRVME